jgi:tetratricopeptide (TPR) repeat protein
MVAQIAAEYAASKRFLETAVNLSRPETDPPHFSTHGQNPGLFALSYLAHTLCYLGLLDQARATIGHCLTIAARRAGDPGHLYGHVNALVHAARVYNHCGDLAAEKRFAEEAQEIARRNHFAYYEAVSRCHLGWVVGCHGSLLEGIEIMLAGLAALEKTGTSLALSRFFLMLAQLYIRAGRWWETALALDRAPQGNPRWDADVERVRGEFLSLRPDADPAAAETAYRASLEIARRQGAALPIFKSSFSLTEFCGDRSAGRKRGMCWRRAWRRFPRGATRRMRNARSCCWRGIGSAKPARRGTAISEEQDEHARSRERTLRQGRDLLLPRRVLERPRRAHARQPAAGRDSGAGPVLSWADGGLRPSPRVSRHERCRRAGAHREPP